MFDYNKINDILDEYCNGASANELIYIQDIVNIVLNNSKDFHSAKMKDSIEVYQSLKMVYKFLNSLDKNYATYFQKAIEDKRLILDYDLYCGCSYFDVEKGKLMCIPISHTISDSFVMSHELMHDMNLKPYKLNLTRHLFTESISILAELLYYDYLVENNLYVHDAKAYIQQVFWHAHRKSMKNDFEIQLMLNYINNGFVNDCTIKNLTTMDREYNYQIAYSLSDMINDGDIGIDCDQRYSIGIIFASYMYDCINNNKGKVGEFLALNELMHDISFNELMYYLDLETERFNNFVLTKESKNILKQSYQKVIKKIG